MLAGKDIRALDLSRSVIVGSSGSGKSTFAARLSKALGSKHIELDNLYWLKDWKVRDEHDFLRLVTESLRTDKWIVDGNYSMTREIVWPKATAIIWLNLPFWLVLWRGFWRTLRRGLTGKRVCGDNKESFYRSFFSKDSILLWIISSFHWRQRELRQLKESNQYRKILFVELRSDQQCRTFLNALREKGKI
jgi:adenylate kinase family enzyme